MAIPHCKGAGVLCAECKRQGERENVGTGASDGRHERNPDGPYGKLYKHSECVCVCVCARTPSSVECPVTVTVGDS